MECRLVAAVCDADECRAVAFYCHLGLLETRLHRKGAAGALLAVQAMADRDPHRLASSEGDQLPA